MYYIIPGIPPPPPIGGIAGASSLMSTKAHSVVKIIPATEAAFSKATRATFLGSMIPSLSMSTKVPGEHPAHQTQSQNLFPLHHEARLISASVYLLILEPLVRDDIFLALGRVKVNW